MEYRKQLNTTEEMAAYYDAKYREMGGTWATPPDECNRHLYDLGVPFNKSKWLLDVGCGGGHFLAEAEKRVRCVGLEISVTAYQYARKRVSKDTCIMVESIEAYGLGWSNSGGCYDYIISMGSLEHVIDIDRALDEIHRLLKDDGRWYFFVPNEQWNHFDQPNERTATDPEWIGLFYRHGLVTDFRKRWNDSTAFAGGKMSEEVLK